MKSKLLIFTILLAFWHQVLVASPVTGDASKFELMAPGEIRELALKSYTDEEFSQSIKSLNALLEQQGPSADIYYNLFVNYEQTGNRGLGLHSLRASLELLPGYSPARLAIKNLDDSWTRIFKTKQSIWQSLLLDLHYATATHYLNWLFLVCLGLFLRCLIQLVKSLRSKSEDEASKLSFFVLSSVLLLFSGLLLASKLYLGATDRATIVIESKAKVTPSESSPEILNLREGEQVIVHSEQDDWLQIEDYEGNRAWLPSNKALYSTKGL